MICVSCVARLFPFSADADDELAAVAILSSLTSASSFVSSNDSINSAGVAGARAARGGSGDNSFVGVHGLDVAARAASAPPPTSRLTSSLAPPPPIYLSTMPVVYRNVFSLFQLRLPPSLVAFFAGTTMFSISALYEIIELWDDKYFGGHRIWSVMDTAEDLQWDLCGIVLGILLARVVRQRRASPLGSVGN